MVALHDVKFVNVTAKSERHTYFLTVFKRSDTKVNLRWQGDPPAADRVTARWKVAVVGGFSNNVPFARRCDQSPAAILYGCLRENP